MTRKQPPEDMNSAERRAGGLPRAGKSARSSVSDRRALGWEKSPLDARSDDADVEGMVIDPEELRDFLSADGQDVGADPVFKERLRETLWKLVEDRYGSGDDDTTER